MTRREPLGVWLHGVHVADITSPGPGKVRCRYTREALQRWPGNVPLLSCSLPLGTGRLDAGEFFSGLLPEGEHRQAMAAVARVPSYDTFGLLERFGRDVAGALIVTREPPQPRPGRAEPYTDAALAEEVSRLPEQPLGLHDDSELSIAGLQDKLLLIARDDGGWARPVHGRPSTHILKVEDRRFPGMVHAEAGCLALARAVGLTSVEAQATTIAELPCLIVSRFDRLVLPDGDLRRIHQEDGCQALARDPEGGMGRGKYESAGGPSLREVAALLDLYAVDPEEQLRRLVAATTFTVCTGNADAHGKNLALLHPTAEHVALAPLYDTVPTVLWSRLRSTAAMAVGGVSELSLVGPGDVAAEAARWPLSRDQAARVARDTAERLLAAATELDLPEELAAYVTERGKRFLAGDRGGASPGAPER